MTFAHAFDVPVRNTACKARSCTPTTPVFHHQIIEMLGVPDFLPESFIRPLQSREETRAGSIAGRMPFLTRISERILMRSLYNSRRAATLALSFSMAFNTPTAIGAAKPLSVFPLIVANPDKSGEPTIAPILQPVPLL